MPGIAFIFGAGASVGATEAGDVLPTQAQLIRTFLALRNVRDERVRASYNTVDTYLRRMYPGRDDFGGLPIEEVLGPLEWLASRESDFHLGQGTMRNLRSIAAFDTLISYVLNTPLISGRRIAMPTADSPDDDRVAFNEFYSVSTESMNVYSRLIARLEASGADYRLVSFNYDLILDRVLYHRSGYGNVNYCVRHFSDGDEASQNADGAVLIKPHGSLNWAWCRFCNQLVVLRNSVIWPGSTCDRCQSTPSGGIVPVYWPYGPRGPLLIRPSFIKDFSISAGVWRDVLREGGRHLMQCSTWVFAGYSFPLADYWVRAWLRRTQAEAGGSHPRLVIVVDPDPTGQVRGRYRDFFDSLVDYRDQTFWEFVNDFDPATDAA